MKLEWVRDQDSVYKKGTCRYLGYDDNDAHRATTYHGASVCRWRLTESTEIHKAATLAKARRAVEKALG